MQPQEDGPASQEQAPEQAAVAHEGPAEAIDFCVVDTAAVAAVAAAQQAQPSTFVLEDDVAAPAILLPVGESSGEGIDAAGVADGDAVADSAVAGGVADQADAVVAPSLDFCPHEVEAAHIQSPPDKEEAEHAGHSHDVEASAKRKTTVKKKKVFHKAGSAKSAGSLQSTSVSPAVVGKESERDATFSQSLELTSVAPASVAPCPTTPVTQAGRVSGASKPSSADKSEKGSVVLEAPCTCKDVEVTSAPCLPPQLPFHFRWDVPCLRLEGLEPHLPTDWERVVAQRLEREWRRCRKEQEQAWVSNGNLPFEVQRLAATMGKSSDEVFARVCDRAQSALWHSEAGSTRPMLPMKVCAFEKLPGQALQKEELEGLALGGLGSSWCYLTYDLSSDPLLLDLAYEGAHPTTFSTLLFAYGAQVADAEMRTCHLRFARMDHFDFALCFPPSPYPTCNLPSPEVDFATLLGLDACSDMSTAEDAMTQARAVLTWLFWDCFDEIFTPNSAEIKLRDRPARTLLPFGVHRRFDTG